MSSSRNDRRFDLWEVILIAGIALVAGVVFADCYGRRRVMDIDGLQVNVIDYEDLVKNKRSTGRTSDQADVERLEKRRNKP